MTKTSIRIRCSQITGLAHLGELQELDADVVPKPVPRRFAGKALVRGTWQRYGRLEHDVSFLVCS